jgi:HD-GYP domain-containing protein (c-di-GMP phosphodiesterase class II)
MVFSLNEFLISTSFALDFIEIDFLGVPTNHGKRVAYIALKLSEKFRLSEEKRYDIVSLSILHDNGVGETFSQGGIITDSRGALILNERVKAHCIIGENNVKSYPFLTDTTNIIKYHHERYDGTGFFNIKGNDIPIMSQIIFLADRVEHEFTNTGVDYKIKKILLIM